MFEKIAYAQEQTQAAPAQSPMHMIFMMGAIFFIFYFLLIRPQQKRQREVQKMIENLKKGDRVVTSGGIIGTVTSIQNDYVVIKIGDNGAKMEVLKSAVSGMRQKSE